MGCGRCFQRFYKEFLLERSGEIRVLCNDRDPERLAELPREFTAVSLPANADISVLLTPPFGRNTIVRKIRGEVVMEKPGGILRDLVRMDKGEVWDHYVSKYILAGAPPVEGSLLLSLEKNPLWKSDAFKKGYLFEHGIHFMHILWLGGHRRIDYAERFALRNPHGYPDVGGYLEIDGNAVLVSKHSFADYKAIIGKTSVNLGGISSNLAYEPLLHFILTGNKKPFLFGIREEIQCVRELENAITEADVKHFEKEDELWRHIKRIIRTRNGKIGRGFSNDYGREGYQKILCRSACGRTS